MISKNHFETAPFYVDRIAEMKNCLEKAVPIEDERNLRLSPGGNRVWLSRPPRSRGIRGSY